jgi:hypothetical protein
VWQGWAEQLLNWLPWVKAGLAAARGAGCGARGRCCKNWVSYDGRRPGWRQESRSVHQTYECCVRGEPVDSAEGLNMEGEASRVKEMPTSQPQQLNGRWMADRLSQLALPFGGWSTLSKLAP